jgi:hypothetical protein
VFSFLIAKKTVAQLSVQLLLIRLHVDAAFQLGASSPDLEPDSAIRDTIMELDEALHAAILQGVFQPGSEIWHKLANGSDDLLV